jgi:hypothetical protein
MPRLRELLLELGGALDSGTSRPFFQQLDAPQLQALDLTGRAATASSRRSPRRRRGCRASRRSS